LILQELLVPLNMLTDGFEKGIDKAKSKSDDLASGLSKIGGGIVGGGLALAGGAIAGISAVTLDAVKSSQAWGEGLKDILDITGMTTDQASGMLLMFQRVGLSGDTLTKSMSLLGKGLGESQDKLGPTGKALASIGISAFDTNGKVKDSVALFQEIADKVGNMPEGLDKTALEMQLFGKSGAELTDVLGVAANGGIQDFINQSKELGLAFSPEQAQQAENYSRSQKEFDQTMLGLKTTLGVGLMPIMSSFNGLMSTLLADPNIKTNITNISTSIGGFLQNVITNIPLGLAKAQEFVTFLQNNQAIVVGILAALGVAATVFGVTTAIGWATALAPMLPVIAFLALIGVAAGLLYTAWKNNFGGIQEKTKAVMDFVKGIFDSFAPFIQFAVDQWTTIFSAFQKLFSGDFRGFGEDIRKAWDNIWTFAKTTFTNFWEDIKKIDWIQLGKDIISGLINGIGSMAGFLHEAAVNVANNALDAIKGFLGIQSPSTVFASVGQNMMKGMALGITGSSNLVNNSVKDISQGVLTTSVNTNINSGNSDVVSAIKNIPSGKDFDYARLGRAVRDAMLQVTG
jgi:hypothetical protein